MDLPVTTRPVRPDDAPLFCRLWDRLSPETVYRRFHAPLRRPPAEAHRLVEVDHDLREALVAGVRGGGGGGGRYERPPPHPRTAHGAVGGEGARPGGGLGPPAARGPQIGGRPGG